MSEKTAEPTGSEFVEVFTRLVNAAWGVPHEPGEPVPVWFFLDDEREPVLSDTRHWAVFRTGEAMLEVIRRFGMPDGISFDHDLGDGRIDGQETAKALVNMALDGALVVDQGFTFLVHSQNPIGAANITATMNDLMKILFAGRM